MRRPVVDTAREKPRPRWKRGDFSSQLTASLAPGELSLESVTGIGVRLEADDSLRIIAPLGTDDLLGLRCRPTDFGATRRSEYEERIASKRWRELWPKVQFLD